MEAEVKLTGILSLGALKAGENRRHGTVIAPGLYAPVHQHFFVARLDMAVDCKPGEGLNQVHATGRFTKTWNSSFQERNSSQHIDGSCILHKMTSSYLHVSNHYRIRRP